MFLICSYMFIISYMFLFLLSKLNNLETEDLLYAPGIAD